MQQRGLDRSGGKAQSRSLDGNRDPTRAAFVMHLDAPWGGGKTTFANFLARVLNPHGFDRSKLSFLHRRYGEVNISTIFLQDPRSPKDGKTFGEVSWPEDARRPWIIVPFNAWQVEHCAPPWWVFYQTIRKRCFQSILREGNNPVSLTYDRSQGRPDFYQRFWTWLSLVRHEYWWRLRNPKITTLLITALTSLIVLVLLYALGIVHVTGKPKEEKVAFNVADGIGLILAGITAIGTVWGLGALVTESIIPGTDSLAERLNLGNGDPFERFRQHFYNTMKRIRRPILVIVDDLDRCKPEFVVDLVRGIQTLLRSARIVFVILGDRDWIERAFENYYKAMDKVSVGLEQTLGARFVEKAIQMSFILPGMHKDRLSDYVRWVLLGNRASPSGQGGLQLDADDTAELRRVIESATEGQRSSPLESEEIQKEAISALEATSLGGQLRNDSRYRAKVEQFVNEELAIHAAVDEKVETEISHRLEPLAPFLPANPRQIKRLINAVTMYHAVALQQNKANDPQWLQLVLWVVLLTEWPKTWRLLASYPNLADILNAAKPDKEITEEYFKTIDNSKIPASQETTLRDLNRIRTNRTLMALIAGWHDRSGPKLNGTAIEKLLEITPIYGRELRYEEKADKSDQNKKKE